MTNNKQRYRKEGFAIIVPINDEYLVRANISKAGRELPYHYNFTLEISETDRNMFQLIGDNEVYCMESDFINRDVADYILKIHDEGFFDAIAARYTYAMKFLDLSMDMLIKVDNIHREGGQNV